MKYKLKRREKAAGTRVCLGVKGKKRKKEMAIECQGEAGTIEEL